MLLKLLNVDKVELHGSFFTEERNEQLDLLRFCVDIGDSADKVGEIDYQAAALAEEMNLNIVTCALNGGEDYELLFTCSLDDYEKLIPIDDLYIIGHITKPEHGCNLIGRNGEEITLKAQGWNAFSRSATKS